MTHKKATANKPSLFCVSFFRIFPSPIFRRLGIGQILPRGVFVPLIAVDGGEAAVFEA